MYMPGMSFESAGISTPSGVKTFTFCALGCDNAAVLYADVAVLLCNGVNPNFGVGLRECPGESGAVQVGVGQFVGFASEGLRVKQAHYLVAAYR